MMPKPVAMEFAPKLKINTLNDCADSKTNAPCPPVPSPQPPNSPAPTTPTSKRHLAGHARSNSAPADASADTDSPSPLPIAATEPNLAHGKSATARKSPSSRQL